MEINHENKKCLAKSASEGCSKIKGDTKKGTEVLINIDAQGKEEVDDMAKIVRNVGGIIFAEPGESQGWMYGFGFEDLDGHRWSMLYMDRTKCRLPQIKVDNGSFNEHRFVVPISLGPFLNLLLFRYSRKAEIRFNQFFIR